MKKNENRLESFRYAAQGVIHAFKNERNFKIHLCAAFCVFWLACFLKVKMEEFLILVLTVTMVMAAEMFNTAIESVVDLYCKDCFHPQAKIAKDVAAGGVLLTAIGSCVVGYGILIRRIIALIAFSSAD
ncbi:MAG: diacylglycerol kinase family protein [Clostridiales bacterium]|jgi:diacylglycerol kinase|nr:diacylglycerol kinase family protein [Clostridiales bacterium]